MPKYLINGLELGYEMEGRGEYLLLIPGLGFGRWLWERQIPFFSKEFTVVAIDNRGVGESGAPKGPYSIQQMASDVRALLKALKIEKAHLLGVSLGGFIAQVLALDYPQLIQRLILVSTTAGGGASQFASLETIQALTKAQQEEDPFKRIKEVLQLTVGPNYKGDLGELVKTYIDRQPPFHAYQAQSQAGTAYWTKEHRAHDIHKIKAKTLVLTGDEDRIVPPENSHLLVDRIPMSRLKVFPGAGHLLMLEVQEAFNEEIMGFLMD